MGVQMVKMHNPMMMMSALPAIRNCFFYFKACTFCKGAKFIKSQEIANLASPQNLPCQCV